MRVHLSIGIESVPLTTSADRYRSGMQRTGDVVDGRRARRERGRLAALDAMIDLLAEGHTPPTAAQVAARAGVSVATVFRYFDTLDELQRQTAARYLERHEGLFEIPGLGEGPLDDRISRLVASRLELYGSIAPIARFVRSRSLDQALLADQLARMRARLTEQVRRHFAVELARRTPAQQEDLVLLVATLTSFESWDQLSSDPARTPAQLRRAWKLGVATLLRPS